MTNPTTSTEDQHNLARVAAAILRTDRELSADFREQMAQVVEALDECISALAMTETAHTMAKQPFYCKGLDMGRKVFSQVGIAQEK